jgi:hypothetical protein
MKTILYGVAAAVAVAVSVGAGETAFANGPRAVVRTPVVRHTTVVRPLVNHNPVYRPTFVRPAYFNSNYHTNYGVRFSHGYYFRGSEFRYFHYRHWNARYRCWTFYYPGTRCWYYWSGSCYYPMSYINQVAPGGVLPTGIDQLPDQLPPDGTLPPDQLPPDGTLPPQ